MADGYSIAHETGTLTWGTWVCDCEDCRQVCLDFPEVLLVIKSSEARTPVLAGKLAQSTAEAFLITDTDYVREVFVAQDQPAPVASWPPVQLSKAMAAMAKTEAETAERDAAENAARRARVMDSPADYGFGGDLWNCPNPQRLAVLYGTAMGWTDVVPQSHLTSGTGISVSYTDHDGAHRTFNVGASFLQDFAANRPGPRVPAWSWPGKTR